METAAVSQASALMPILQTVAQALMAIFLFVITGLLSWIAKTTVSSLLAISLLQKDVKQLDKNIETQNTSFKEQVTEIKDNVKGIKEEMVKIVAHDKIIAVMGNQVENVKGEVEMLMQRANEIFSA